jgi:response regulator RpfG family c-di-GMP phosphodiesterase
MNIASLLRSQLRPAKTVELPAGAVPPLGDHVLRELLDSHIIRARDWEALPESMRQTVARHRQQGPLLDELTSLRLLTPYQAERLKSGAVFGLVLGNYRVLEVLGTGGMGVVYKAEHLRLPRLVAIKVLPLSPDQDPRLLDRFDAEMGAVAQLQHPNIVGAVDAGEANDPSSGGPRLHYFVMDYVAGENLEERVKAHGPLAPAAACDLVHQIASALAEAHHYGLVHRDIKPSNIIVTPEGQAKLLDFGLALRLGGGRLTEPGVALGTLDYVAPEQARDAHSVDIRADIYALGATLFWCLTGRAPFAACGDAVQSLVARMAQGPPSVRVWRTDLSEPLDAVVARMMAVEPVQRYSTPKAVIQAIMPFLSAASRHGGTRFEIDLGTPSAEVADPTRVRRVLIVDDDAGVRDMCRYTLESDGIRCDEAVHGAAALNSLKSQAYDLVVSDVDMPELDGLALLREVRSQPPCPHLKVIMFSGRASGDEMSKMLLAGADDYLTKPVSVVQLLSRVKAALHLKEAQDRSDVLNRQLLAANALLEQNLTARDSDLAEARNALVLALAELTCHREAESPAHLLRMQRYARLLAEEAARSPEFADSLDDNFIRLLECCAPLHDIGKVGLPDHILLKPGKLDAAERLIMQTHTTIGAETLQKVAQRHGFAAAFLRMAIDIVRHHHERYDGRGYPDRLAGDTIPLAARIVCLADVYDALRSRRPYKPPLSHAAAMQVMTEASAGQFDPRLLATFERCATKFERIVREVPD